MTDLRIDAAGPGDADALERLIHRVRRELFGDTDPPPAAATVRQAIEREHTWLFVARRRGEIVGYCAAHRIPFSLSGGEEGYLSELFIAATERGTGVGGALHDRAVATARAAGLLRLRLINGRHRESYKRGFYARRGWRERAEYADFVLDLRTG